MNHLPNEPITRIIGPISQAVNRLRSEGVGRRWVVAVSGGSDSVGLLRALVLVRDQEQVVGERLELSVAHLDHGLRGQESEADGAFVAELADQLDLPFDLGHWSPKRTHHVESDARAARYAWLAEVAQRRNAQAVAVAHTRDDQAETVLHRILRGTGPNGLAGMSLRRPLGTGIGLVRPLLKVRRADLSEFVQSLGQVFRVDASNLDLRHTRNRIRRDLLPKLAQDYNPEVVEALARLADLVQAESHDRSMQILEQQRIATTEERQESTTFDLSTFQKFSPNIRAEVLRLSWRRLGHPERSMTAKLWEACALLAERTQGRINLPGGVSLSVGEGRLILARLRNEPDDHPPLDHPVPLPLPGSALWKSWKLHVSLDQTEGYGEVIDADRRENACGACGAF